MLNWSHFKPEFAGRPEEDAEAHLLCTNDWNITHNFTNDVKVQRFCLILVGEAGLWYESLTPIANNWPALQESFRRQCSKIGNTREPLFHVWRPFHYDEYSEAVDAYVNSIRQVAAMLHYGELQILEVCKNTILNRLYWILFPIDNLRVAVETAKRVLTKEKIDRQMSGQSSTTLFMKASWENNYSSMKGCKKGVTFDVMETIERNSDIVDRLTSLVSKMNIKVDKWETQYKPQVYQIGIEAKAEIGKTIISLGTDPSVEIEINLLETEEIIIETIIDPIIEADQEKTIGMMIGETTIDVMPGKTITDQMIGKTIIDRTIEGTITEIDQIMGGTINRDIEIEVKVRRMQEIIIERIQEKDLREIEVEKEVEIEVDIDKCNQEWEHYQMKERIGQDQNLDLDPIQE